MALPNIYKVYKAFQTLRTAPILLMGALAVCFYTLMVGPAMAQSGNPLFTIENVKVDVSAENALKAREQAFEQAQLKAFKELASRMLPDTQSVETPPLMAISTMIQDYEVSDEKLSSKRYIGTYKFRFKDRSVKRYFSGQGAEYTDVASQPILVLPFLETANGTILWSHQNAWMKAWASAPNLSSGLVPIVVPLGDLSDVSDIGDDAVLTYNRRSLQNMVARYRSSEAVIAIARAEGTGLSVQIYRTDRSQPEYVHQILERALPNQTQDQLYARAAQSVKAALSKDWKKKTVVDTRQQGSITVHVTFSSLQEWSNIQRSLKRVYGISNMQLQALSPKDAYLELTYEGTFDRLKLSLEQASLFLSPQPANVGASANYNADYSQGMLGSYGAQQQATTYELYTRKAGSVVQPQRTMPERYQTRF